MTRRHFQKLVVFSQVLVVVGFVVQYATEHTLPLELLSYRYSTGSVLTPDTATIIDHITYVPFQISLAFGLLAAIGLYLFREWGRQLFLIYVTVGLTLTPFWGPYISTGWSGLVGYASTLIDGMLVALVYFSPLKNEFQTESTDVETLDESTG